MGHIYYKCECSRCGRKILVEQVCFGTVHNTIPQVTCAECVHIVPAYRSQFPECAKDIEDWVNAGRTLN